MQFLKHLVEKIQEVRFIIGNELKFTQVELISFFDFKSVNLCNVSFRLHTMSELTKFECLHAKERPLLIISNKKKKLFHTI